MFTDSTAKRLFRSGRSIWGDCEFDGGIDYAHERIESVEFDVGLGGNFRCAACCEQACERYFKNEFHSCLAAKVLKGGILDDSGKNSPIGRDLSVVDDFVQAEPVCAGLQGLLQIDHIYQLSAVLDDGVVVMIGEEAGDRVRANVSASFVKRVCGEHPRCRREASGNAPGSTPPEIRAFVVRILSVDTGGYSQILDLSDSVGFVRDDAFGDDLSVVTGYEHFAPFQVAVDHGFLFVGQQEQVEEAFLCVVIFSNRRGMTGEFS